ncbi:MAG TPA: hypothetical protein VGE76_00275 [Opitutaceae bacterium]
MPRLPLILCLVALAGSVASAVLFLRIGNSKQLLEARLADAATRTSKLESSLAEANEQSGALKQQLQAASANVTEARTQLEAARAQATAAEAKAAQTSVELAQAKAVVGIYEQTARALAEDLEALRQDIATLRATHASPEAVEAYKGTIAELEKQLASARSGTATPRIAGASTAVFTNRAGRATILSVGPQNAFVVLNFGSARGAKLGHKLIVSQGDTPVATVAISDVRNNFSVAQVLPDTVKAVLQKGDEAVLQR